MEFGDCSVPHLIADHSKPSSRRGQSETKSQPEMASPCPPFHVGIDYEGCDGKPDHRESDGVQ